MARNSAAADEVPSEDEGGAGAGKGRATPRRREAEQARRQALRVPKDPKAARRAMRDRQRSEQDAQRRAMLSGDESRLPAREAGPVKAMVRAYVDARFSIGEMFIPFAVLVIVLTLIPNPTVARLVYFGWIAAMVVVVVDEVLLIRGLRRQLTAHFPDPAQRRDTTLYAVTRSLQLRRLRLPPPRVLIGGQPVPAGTRAPGALRQLLGRGGSGPGGSGSAGSGRGGSGRGRSRLG